MKFASHYKRLLLVLLSVCVCAGAFHVLGSRKNPTAASTSVVISQIYGGGGNSGATLKNDFIELFNTSAAPVDISNWSIQYGSANGSTWQVTNLCPSGACTIAPGHYFLIQEEQGAAGTSDLPAPDASGNISMGSVSGKVVLVDSKTAVSGPCPNTANLGVDFVSWGGANCFQGNGATKSLSNTTAAIRINNGCTDTDN